MRLTPEGTGTRSKLEHQAPVDRDFAARYGPGAVGVGWDLGLLGLARHLAGPDARRRTDEDATET